MKLFRGITFVLSFLVCTSILASAEISEEKAMAIFKEAGVNFKDKNYAKAIEGYESILLEGKESGALYYNLGNSYYKSGNLGKAILNYERAKQMIPRDSDLKFNYQYAILDVREQINEVSKNFFQKLIDGHVTFYSLDEMAIVVGMLFLLLGVLHLISLFLKWASKTRTLTLTIVGIFLLVYGVGFILKLNIQKDLAVVLQRTESKFEPRTDATTHFNVAEGAKVKVINVQANWVKIERRDGKLGWIEESLLEKI